MSHTDDFVHVRGARQNNLRSIDLDIPRDTMVVFTGVSGSGKSSLAFDTIYAEAQRRYFESVAPYARRLIEQLPAPRVTEIIGLPPAVALQQRRGEATMRSSVGTVTTISNSLRMLFSRAGTYPEGTTERLDSDAFSPNTPAGACDACHGIGITYSITEESLVPDPSLSIRDHAIAAWPGAWQGKNLRDILAVLGYDIDKPWKDLPAKDREWILFTEEKPVVTVHAEREAHRIQRPYQGTYMSAAHYVRHTFATTRSESLRKRAAKFMAPSMCPSCKGKRLHGKSLSVTFAGLDIADFGRLPLSSLPAVLSNAPELHGQRDVTTESQKALKLTQTKRAGPNPGDTGEVARLLTDELISRIQTLRDLGLDYLSLDRATPTLSSGELQRLRLATQLRSGLFGVVYVLDEPSAGLHPADTESLLRMLHQLIAAGNSLFIVEHDLAVVKQASWIVDIGPNAGEDGGRLIYNGPVDGLKGIEESHTRRFLFSAERQKKQTRRTSNDWLRLRGVSRHNLHNLDVDFPLKTLTVVTGVSGAGKSTLVNKVLVDLVANKAERLKREEEEEPDEDENSDPLVEGEGVTSAEGLELIDRLVYVDQKPIGRTPRSNLATYTGMFDNIRQKFAAVEQSKKRKYTAGRFSFNVDGGRCNTCEGEGFVSVELLFLPSVYAPCSTCRGARYNEETLQIQYKGLSISQVLDLTVDAAFEFFVDVPSVIRSLKTLNEVGLGYLKLGQPATELSGGEAQRIKLATELQRTRRGHTMYLLDEPTTGLHPADTENLIKQMHGLVDSGNTVIVVEHDIAVIREADWVIDLGPGGGEHGGRVVAVGPPEEIASSRQSRTGPFLAAEFALNRT